MFRPLNLALPVITKSLEKSKIKNNEIDEVIMGQVLTGGGQNHSTSGYQIGISIDKPAYIVNQVCGSGLRSVASGFQSIKSGDSKIIIAGGQESMSLSLMQYI